MESILIEGKTKIIYHVPGDPHAVDAHSKDDATAKNGQLHVIIPGKGESSTTTSSNVFTMFENNGLATAFVCQKDPRTMRMCWGDMLPYECVIRYEVDPDSSYKKRHPDVPAGHRFSIPRLEFYLKTNGPEFKGIALPDTDPLITSMGPGSITVHHPGKPKEGPGVTISSRLLYVAGALPNFAKLKRLMQRGGAVLAGACAAQECRLIDAKFEFDSQYRFSDVVDGDSIRQLGPDGKHLDKQPLRNGASIEEMERIYEEIARRSAGYPEYRLAA